MTYAISEKDCKLFKAAQEGDVETVREYIENNEYCDGTDSDGNNIFHIAAKYGKTEIVEELTRDLGWWKTYIYGPSLPDINKKNATEDTPLHCASDAGHTETAKTLIQKQADIKILNKKRKSALFTALKKDNATLVKAFILAGLDPATYENHGIHMFHYAIKHHANNTVQYFAQQKTLLNQSSRGGIKPIHVAAKSNNVIGLDILLFYGADLCATDDSGNTAGHYSAYYGTKEIMSRLLQQPAFNLNITNKAGNDVPAIAVLNKKSDILISLCSQTIIDVNKRHADGSSYAMMAAREGSNKTLEFLIDKNADLDITDKYGKNILHILGEANNYQGAECVLQRGGSSLLSVFDNDDNQPLFIAMLAENPNIARLYIEYGAPLLTFNKSGDSIFHHAVKCKKAMLISQLISHNVPIVVNPQTGLYFYHYLVDQGDANAIKEFRKKIAMDHLTPEGDNILQYALKHGKLACAHELLDQAFVNHANNAGKTPAILAAQKNMPSIIHELKRRHVDLTITDKYGSGIIHHAAAHGSIDVLEQLAEYGFSFVQKTDKGNTAMHIAAINNQASALRFFKERGENFDLRNNSGQTALVAGAFAGNLQATKELLSERAFIGDDVSDILNHLYYATDNNQKKVYSLVKQEHEKRFDESAAIEQEYPSYIVDGNKRLLTELCQGGDIAAALELLRYNPEMPAYKTAAQIYKMDHSHRVQIQNTYRHHKNEALQYQVTLQQRKMNLVEQKAQAESKARADAVRAQIQERDKKIAAEQAAQREAAKAKQEQDRKEREAIRAQEQRVQALKNEQEHKEREAINTQERLLQQCQQNVQPQRNTQTSTSHQESSIDMQAYVQNLQPSAPPADEGQKDSDAATSEETRNECIVCYYPKPLVPTTCGNVHPDSICETCLDKLKKDKSPCPLCRSPLS